MCVCVWCVGRAGGKEPAAAHHMQPQPHNRPNNAAAADHHQREAAVHGIGSAANLSQIRAQLKAAGRLAAPRLPGPRPRVAQGPTYDKRLALYTLPFPGADASIVRRTQAALAAAGEPAVHFTARFGVPSAYYAAVAVLVGGTLMALAKHGWGRAILLKCGFGLWGEGWVWGFGAGIKSSSQGHFTPTSRATDLASPRPRPPPSAPHRPSPRHRPNPNPQEPGPDVLRARQPRGPHPRADGVGGLRADHGGQRLRKRRARRRGCEARQEGAADDQDGGPWVSGGCLLWLRSRFVVVVVFGTGFRDG